MAAPRLVVITPPHTLPGEIAAVQQLLAAGCERIHLRKPDSSPQQLAAWCVAVGGDRQRLSVHGSVAVAQALGCGGIHGPEADGAQGFCRSASWHSAEECAGQLDYGLLAPVFASTSKHGYGPAFSETQARHLCRHCPLPVLALGGITPETAPRAMAWGFAGVAVLGWLWQALDQGPHEVVAAWRKLNQALALPSGLDSGVGGENRHPYSGFTQQGSNCAR